MVWARSEATPRPASAIALPWGQNTTCQIKY
jgi:hypothetical protein